MPIHLIPEDQYIFPHPSHADSQGILGIGGDLSPQRLITAYSFGIFPWFSEDDPILWWSPDPRFVLFPMNLKIHKSMRSYLNQNKFRVTFDKNFQDVMLACQRIPRIGQEGTWITNDMLDAYTKLHQLGYAHSVEVWKDGKLAGGLYGVSLGKMFFGESMFSLAPNASKFALIKLTQALIKKGFSLIDCQQETKHLATMGAKSISRTAFLDLLSANRLKKNHIGSWADWI